MYKLWSEQNNPRSMHAAEVKAVNHYFNNKKMWLEKRKKMSWKNGGTKKTFFLQPFENIDRFIVMQKAINYDF